MVANLVLALGMMIVVGFFAGSLAHRVGSPRITGYIVAGIVLSPTVTGVIGEKTIDQLEILTTIALGVIAYSVGGSLSLSRLRQHERTILWITPLQAIAALFVTAGGCLLALLLSGSTLSGSLHSAHLPVALVLGAIASATAPATILAIVRELKAKGPITTTLLSVVAIDDAVAILVFAVTLGISRGLAGSTEGVTLISMLGEPALEIALSVAFGALCGFVLVRAAVLARERSLMLALVLGSVTLCVGLSEVFGGSPLLANMVLGMTVANSSNAFRFFEVVDYIEDALFAVFFVLSGLHFSLAAMRTAGLLGLVAAVCRATGKYAGANAGARLAGTPPQVGRYLGLALLPAAGVSLGLGLVAQRAFPDTGTLIYNTVLVMVVINEVVGPVLGEHALLRSGEGIR